MPDPDKKTATSSVGCVILIGAGPGDPGLLTVRGRERLRTAEVVVYDALADRSLLDLAPASAELIDAGKRAKAHTLTQDQINALLVDRARQGKRVVRLKGGDPLLFGRGAEEAACVAAHGIPCEIIPGITAGLAAPTYAGIPVTHRQGASTVTLVTGHEDPTKGASHVDYPALARLAQAGGTICFYMGVGRIAEIIAALTGAGLSDLTPGAVVQWGTTPRQQSVRAPLRNLAQAVAQAGLGAPAIIVVGQVAGMEAPGLDGFLRRPLRGRRILVTRTRQQVSELRTQLEELGAQVLEAPTIELQAPEAEDLARIDATLRRVRDFAWLVLTSVHGVTALQQRLSALTLDARALAGVKIAAIGSATARALAEELGLRADLVPTEYVAESLAAELLARENLRGRNILLWRADIARPALPQLLTQAGAEVTDLAVYQTRVPEALPAEVRAALDAGAVDWVTFTSSSTATNLAQLLGPRKHLLAKVQRASIGPITSATMRALGWEPTVEATPHDIPGLVAALVHAATMTSGQ